MKKITALLLLLALFASMAAVASAENLDYYFVATFNTSPKFYTGPGTNYLRANNGKAQYGGGGAARVYGYEGRWLMLGYETKDGLYRIGYFQDTYLQNMSSSSGQKPRKLNFEYRSAWLNRKVDITDDPVIMNVPFATLASGTACSYLASYDDRWAYIEVTVPKENRKARGFVPMEAVSFGTHTVTAVPYTFTTPVPQTGTPDYSTGFFGNGTWATASTPLSTYSGPGAYYTFTGTFYVQNQPIYCLSKHYDGSGWWILCRISDGSGAQYVWANAGCFFNSDWLLNRLPQE